MGYESVSTIIVAVIVLIGIVVWLPIRTANSMRHVQEHSADRFSASLHLVDENSGTRFSDDTTYAKGVWMQPDERHTNTLNPKRIAEVRRLRHAAVRRRQIIVAVLLAITVLVPVLAFALHFSPWFALIPAVLTAVVLALGAHASSQARAWESKVAAARARERKAKVNGARKQAKSLSDRAERMQAEIARAQDAHEAHGEDEAHAADSAAEQVIEAESAESDEFHDDAPTDEMERREIRRVLRQAQIEQRKALAEHGKLETPEQAARNADAVQGATATAGEQVVAKVVSANEAAASASQPSQSAPTAGDVAGEVVESTDVVESAVPADATTELAEVRPARALDAFEMATSQDLISFSLGEPRNGVEEGATAPESREIKSTRQVAKAEPLETSEQQALIAEAHMETEPATDDAASENSAAPTESGDVADETATAGTAEAGSVDTAEADETTESHADDVTDVEAFHESEEQAKVAVPAATSDSLGRDLASILARRNG